MMRNPPQRPRRSYPNAKRMIVECELEACVHCGEQLVPSGTWQTRKTVQTMGGPLFVAGKSKKCDCIDCSHYGQHYHARGVLRISLPYCTYGLDVQAFIGWQHEHEHEQFVELQELLKQGGIEVCERHVGRLYRQFLALLGGINERVERRLDETAEKHGGVMRGIDALQPEGHGTLLDVLYGSAEWDTGSGNSVGSSHGGRFGRMVETVPGVAIPGPGHPIRRRKGDHRSIRDMLARCATTAMPGALSGESS